MYGHIWKRLVIYVMAPGRTHEWTPERNPDGPRTYIFAYYSHCSLLSKMTLQCWYSQRKHQTLMNIKWNRCMVSLPNISSFHFNCIILSISFHFDFITPGLSLFSPPRQGSVSLIYLNDMSSGWLFPIITLPFPFILLHYVLCRMFFEI